MENIFWILASAVMIIGIIAEIINIIEQRRINKEFVKILNSKLEKEKRKNG